MGTASSTKVLKNNAGTLQEVAALTTSSGAGDEQALVALNASGLIDDSMMNASASSAANKVVKMNGFGVIDPAILNASASSAANKIPVMDGSGRLLATMMPVGFGDDVKTIIASEALSAGNLVNLWNNAGTVNMRKADATTSGKHAHGFVLAAVASAASGVVFFEGANTAVTGLTPGDQFLSTTPGGAQAAAPAAAGNVVQRVGVAVSATELNFEAQTPIVLA